MRRGFLPSYLPLGIVLALAAFFRLPPLLNAGELNSDAAVVGLQGQHMLHGELAFHLWHTDYQGAFDSLLAGLFSTVLGRSPAALFAVPFVGALVMITLAFDVLQRRLPPWSAAFAVMPLVFAPIASNWPMLYMMRQSLATVLVLAVWLADRAAEGVGTSRRRLSLALVACVFALYIDLFAVVTLPALVVFILACAVDRETFERVAFGRTGQRVLVGIALAGFLVLAGALAVSPKVRENLVLLVSTCLPFALGTSVFVHDEGIAAPRWDAPLPIFLLQVVGASVFVLSVLSAGPLAASRRVPWEIRRLGALGLVVTLTTLAGFLVSGKPIDMWSCRYLAPIFWFAPFSFAPLAHWLGGPRLLAGHAPYWVTALIGGWLGYGIQVDGPVPRTHPRATGAAEATLKSELLREGVHAAESHYWLAYRLTFLFREDPVVVPLERGSDRYAPYREAVDRADRRALLVHPSEPRAKPETYEAKLAATGTRWERREIAGYTVLLVTAPPSPPP